MKAVQWRSTTSGGVGRIAHDARRMSVTGILVGVAIFLAACTGGTAADSDGAANAASRTRSSPTRARIGNPAPAYAARTIAGDSVSLADHRGRVVLLNIWATWCHPCRTEIPELQALYEKERERGLEVIGVSIDAGGEDAAVADFAREYGVTYPIWRDGDGRVSTTFAAVGVPATYLIDRDGVLRWSHLGPVTASDPALVQALETALGGGS